MLIGRFRRDDVPLFNYFELQEVFIRKNTETDEQSLVNMAYDTLKQIRY